MVQFMALDRTFSALSDATRRDILERLGRGPASISELARPSGMSLTGLKKHVSTLEAAGLVTTEKVGRTRTCRLAPDHLDDAMQWIAVHRRRWQPPPPPGHDHHRQGKRPEALDGSVRGREQPA